MPVGRSSTPDPPMVSAWPSQAALASDSALEGSGELLELTAEVLGQLFGERYGHPTSGAQAEFDGRRLLVSFTARLAPYERELIAADREWLVEDMRAAFQDAMAPIFKATVEERTGRRVLSQAGSFLPGEQRCRLIFVLAPEEDRHA